MPAVGERVLSNAMVGETDDMKLNGIVIRRAPARATSDETTTVTA